MTNKILDMGDLIMARDLEERARVKKGFKALTDPPANAGSTRKGESEDVPLDDDERLIEAMRRGREQAEGRAINAGEMDSARDLVGHFRRAHAQAPNTPDMGDLIMARDLEERARARRMAPKPRAGAERASGDGSDSPGSKATEPASLDPNSTQQSLRWSRATLAQFKRAQAESVDMGDAIMERDLAARRARTGRRRCSRK